MSRLALPRPLLPAQVRSLRSKAFLRAVFGGLGSGKTTIAALCASQLRAANPGCAGLILSASWSTLKQSGLKALLEVLPPRSYVYKRGDRELHFRDGSSILMRSVKGLTTGLTVAWVWADEVHLIKEQAIWADIQMRVRDARAARPGIIVSGIPVEIGWLRLAFGMPEHYADPARHIEHLSTHDNRYLPPQVLEQLISSVGLADSESYLLGRWHKPEDALFPEYDAPTHVVERPIDRSRPVHLGLDVGSQACAIVLQDLRLPDGSLGLHVVDEVFSDDQTSDALIERVRARGWTVNAASTVAIDPRCMFDTIAALRRVLPPGTRLIRYKDGQPQYSIVWGVRSMRAAFRDGAGRVHLTLSPRLPQGKRSLLTGLPAAKWRVPGHAWKRDNITDHAIDCLRYQVVTHLPIVERPKIEVRRT